MREQTLRQREALDRAYPMKGSSYDSALIVCACCIASVVLGAVALLVRYVWPYVATAITAALN